MEYVCGIRTLSYDECTSAKYRSFAWIKEKLNKHKPAIKTTLAQLTKENQKIYKKYATK